MPYVVGSLLQEKSSTSYNDTTQYHIWDSGINKNHRNSKDCQFEEEKNLPFLIQQLFINSPKDFKIHN